MPFNRGMDKMLPIHTMEHYSEIKRNVSTYPCNDIDEFPVHLSKWKRSDPKSCVAYNSFLWHFREGEKDRNEEQTQFPGVYELRGV